MKDYKALSWVAVALSLTGGFMGGLYVNTNVPKEQTFTCEYTQHLPNNDTFRITGTCTLKDMQGLRDSFAEYTSLEQKLI